MTHYINPRCGPFDSWGHVWHEWESHRHGQSELVSRNAFYFLKFMENINWKPYMLGFFNGYHGHGYSMPPYIYIEFEEKIGRWYKHIDITFRPNDYNDVSFSGTTSSGAQSSGGSHQIGDWYDLLNEMRGYCT